MSEHRPTRGSVALGLAQRALSSLGGALGKAPLDEKLLSRATDSLEGLCELLGQPGALAERVLDGQWGRDRLRAELAQANELLGRALRDVRDAHDELERALTERDEARAEAEGATDDGWRPASEPPSDGRRVLVWIGWHDGAAWVGWHDRERWRLMATPALKKRTHPDDAYRGMVTHWRELPEGPRRER